MASGGTAYSGDHAHLEDGNQVTQMQHIAGKQSISARIMPRRLSRAHSATVIPTHNFTSAESNVLIGVSVQEATEDAAPQDGDGTIPERRASVQALGIPALRTKTSKSSLILTKSSNAGWLSKAKGLTSKFRRKANGKPSE